MNQRTRNISRLIPLAVFVLIIASIQMPVQAHSPGPMTLSYDVESDTLLVEVTHSVSGDHRVLQIQVWKNDVLVNTRAYDAPQETTSGIDDTYPFFSRTFYLLYISRYAVFRGLINTL